MGARGPAPTPTPIMQMRGTFRSDRHGGGPVLPVEIPECPPWLKGEGRAEWNRVVPQLEKMGCIALVDRACLAGYCDAWGDYVALAKQMAKEKDLAGKLAKAKRAALEVASKLAQQFGLTPASRSRGLGHRKEEKPSDGKARFFSTSN